jgi:hypothetical protein
MPLLRDRAIFMQGVRFLHLYHNYFLNGPTMKMIEALSLITASEHFSTYKDQYIPSASDARDLLSLQENVLHGYRNDSTLRTVMRPLTDSVSQMKRRYKLK